MELDTSPATTTAITLQYCQRVVNQEILNLGNPILYPLHPIILSPGLFRFGSSDNLIVIIITSSNYYYLLNQSIIYVDHSWSSRIRAGKDTLVLNIKLFVFKIVYWLYSFFRGSTNSALPSTTATTTTTTAVTLS